MQKSILFFCLVIFSLYAASSITTDKVRSFAKNKNIYEVTFWGNSKVFRLNENSEELDCLGNAYKLETRVDLGFDKAGNIASCRASAGPIPGKSTAR